MVSSLTAKSSKLRKVFRGLFWLLVGVFAFFYGGTVLIGIPIFIGIKTTLGWLVYEIGIILLFLVPSILCILLLRKFLRKPLFGQANEDELKREDDILLQATAFSQAALFIYLNLLPSGDFVNILKLTVPIVAVSFYLVRAYAKLKNDNLWRYRSDFVLVAVVDVTLYSFVMTGIQMEHWINNILIVDGADLTAPFFGSFWVSVTVSVLFLIPVLKVRYMGKVSQGVS
jgi:MFS family permease